MTTSDEAFRIHVNAAPSEDDVRQMARMVHPSQFKKHAFGLVCWIFVIAIFAYEFEHATITDLKAPGMLRSLPPVTSPWFWFGVACILILVGCFVYVWRKGTRVANAQMKQLTATFQLLLTDVRLELQFSDAVVQIPWTSFTKFVCENDTTLFWTEKRLVLWWNRRWFASDADYERVMACARAKVGTSERPGQHEGAKQANFQTFSAS